MSYFGVQLKAASSSTVTHTTLHLAQTLNDSSLCAVCLKYKVHSLEKGMDQSSEC